MKRMEHIICVFHVPAGYVTEQGVIYLSHNYEVTLEIVVNRTDTVECILYLA